MHPRAGGVPRSSREVAERWFNAAAALLDLGENLDRAPVVNPTSIATVELMDLVDAPFPDACRDPELAAALAATGYTELGFDSVNPYFSIVQESSALNCDMQWEEKDNWPTVRMYSPIWNGPEDIRIPPDFLDHPDNQTIIRSIEILKREIGDEVAIVGKTMGPWTLAYHVFGVENFLLMTVDDPDKVKRCLDGLKEISVLFGEAQIAAGDVDRDLDGQPLAPPLLGLGEHAVDHVMGDGPHEVGLLGDRQELRGSDDALFGMSPAQQGLHPHQLPVDQADLGLEVQLQLLAVDRAA